MGQRFGTLHALGPALDVDRPGEIALVIDQEDRPQAVAESMNAFNRRQMNVIPRRAWRIDSTRRGGVVLRP